VPYKEEASKWNDWRDLLEKRFGVLSGYAIGCPIKKPCHPIKLQEGFQGASKRGIARVISVSENRSKEGFWK
jgi:hypothetical protein